MDENIRTLEGTGLEIRDATGVTVQRWDEFLAKVTTFWVENLARITNFSATDAKTLK